MPEAAPRVPRREDPVADTYSRPEPAPRPSIRPFLEPDLPPVEDKD